MLLVDKPAGITSHGAISRLRRALGVRRVGHAGTLDPDATGLLVVGVGAGTRLLTFLSGLDKRYDATVRLGIASTTDDASGTVVSRDGCRPDVDAAGALAAFRGPVRQRPSAVSAVKVAGQRAYRRVRAGETVELAERDVTIHELAVGAVRPTTADGVPVLDVDLEVQVSSGTYIRAIARDLGVALGVGGHLTALRRTAVGPFDVTDATPVDAVTAADLRPLGAAARAVLPAAVIADDHARLVRHGVRVACAADAPTASTEGTPTALVDGGGDLLAVAESRAGRWEYLFVVPA